MKDIVIFVLLAGILAFNGFLFMKIGTLENKVASYEARSQYWDKAVEILEDCLEYNTFGECKQKYPQYREQFQ